MKAADFINDVVIPYFIGCVNENILSVVFGLDGRIIIATNKFAQLRGFENWEQIKDKDYYQANKFHPEQTNNFFNSWKRVITTVINEERAVYYIGFRNYSAAEFVISDNMAFPIFMPNGKVVAVRTVSKKISLLNPLYAFGQYIKIAEVNAENINQQKFNNYNLTGLEYKILFLLYIGLKQFAAASILYISRSNLAKILNQKIYPKLGIRPKCIDELLEFLTENHIITYIPEIANKSECIIMKDNESL